MSRALKCDRCGYYASECDTCGKWRRIEIRSSYDLCEYDICENCKDQLFIFLGKKELKQKCGAGAAS